jgi:hypothetical protein
MFKEVHKNFVFNLLGVLLPDDGQWHCSEFLGSSKTGACPRTCSPSRTSSTTCVDFLKNLDAFPRQRRRSSLAPSPGRLGCWVLVRVGARMLRSCSRSETIPEARITSCYTDMFIETVITKGDSVEVRFILNGGALCLLCLPARLDGNTTWDHEKVEIMNIVILARIVKIERITCRRARWRENHDSQ